MSIAFVKMLKAIPGNLKSNNPLQVGKALTTIFLMSVIILAVLPQHTSEHGWEWRLTALLFSPSNEIGDTLAGVAGVLAFLWIIITVWLQSQELAEQRKELKATRSELKLSREAQEKQVAALDAQAKVFEDEKRYRDHARAKETLEQKLRTFRSLLSENEEKVRWRRTERHSEMFAIPSDIRFFDNSKKLDELKTDEYVFKQCQKVERSVKLLLELHHSNDLVECPAQEGLREILDKLVDIEDLQKRISEDQIERLQTIGFTRMLAALRDALKADIWSKDETSQ